MTCVLASCCSKWYECVECHDEQNSHLFEYSQQLRLTCKACNNCFDRDLNRFHNADKFCDNCGVAWCITGITPESKAFNESLQIMDEYLNSALYKSNEIFKLSTTRKH